MSIQSLAGYPEAGHLLFIYNNNKSYHGIHPLQNSKPLILLSMKEMTFEVILFQHVNLPT
jgi:hypothetical protein